MTVSSAKAEPSSPQMAVGASTSALPRVREQVPPTLIWSNSAQELPRSSVQEPLCTVSSSWLFRLPLLSP